jgi:hypothetical protein
MAQSWRPRVTCVVILVAKRVRRFETHEPPNSRATGGLGPPEVMRGLGYLVKWMAHHPRDLLHLYPGRIGAVLRYFEVLTTYPQGLGSV